MGKDPLLIELTCKCFIFAEISHFFILYLGNDGKLYVVLRHEMPSPAEFNISLKSYNLLKLSSPFKSTKILNFSDPVLISFVDMLMLLFMSDLCMCPSFCTAFY